MNDLSYFELRFNGGSFPHCKKLHRLCHDICNFLDLFTAVTNEKMSFKVLYVYQRVFIRLNKTNNESQELTKHYCQEEFWAPRAP